MTDDDLVTHPDHSIRRDAWQVWWGTQPHPCGPDCRTHGQCDVAAAAQQRIEETMARHTHIICRTCGTRINVPQRHWSGALRWARSRGWDSGRHSRAAALRCPACVRGPAIPAVVAPPERDMTDIDALIARRRAEADALKELVFAQDRAPGVAAPPPTPHRHNASRMFVGGM